MNREYVLEHLKEAAEELYRTIKDIETDSTFEYGDFLPAIQHLFHHINTAWNAQNATESQVAECSEADWNRWRQFPEDIDLSS